MIFSRVNSGLLWSNGFWTSPLSCCQCLSLMAGFLRSWMSGMVLLKVSMRSFRLPHIVQSVFSLTSLATLFRFLSKVCACRPISSVARDLKVPTFHVSQDVCHSLTSPQICSRCSRSFSRRRMTWEGGWSILNMFRPILISFSCASRALSCERILSMNSKASGMDTSALKGPLLSNSSEICVIVFLKSSAEWRRPVLNFSLCFLSLLSALTKHC